MQTDTAPTTPTFLDRIAQGAILIAGLALIALVAVQGWQVFARYVINASPSWTEPVTLLLLSTTMSLAAAAGVHRRRHFTFNLLAEAAGAGAQRAMSAASDVVVLTVGGSLAFGAFRLWLDGSDVLMAGARLPQGSAFLPLGIGGALMVLFALGHLFAAWRRPLPPEGA